MQGLEWTSDNLRLAYRTVNLDLRETPETSIDNSLIGLIFLLDYFLSNQPKLTRAYHDAVDRCLTHSEMRDKTARIIARYVNTQGDAGAADPWVSFNSLVKDMLLGATFFLWWHINGALWFNSVETLS